MTAPATSSLWSQLTPELQEVLRRSQALPQMQLPGSPQLRPLMLIVETINICNSECVFCPYTVQTRPKGVMPQPLFERVVAQYLELGGGAFSLTPMVGDALLDPKLLQRLDALQPHRGKLRPSLTTNLYALGRWDDDAVRRMLTGLDRIHVSVYGITPEENREITRKNLHGALCTQMPRLLALAAELPHAAEIAVGFRTLHDYSPADLEHFQRTTFGRVIAAVGATATYANWGGSMRGPLPGHARWVAERENSTACLLLALALQVFQDGRVSACACCDYDASEQLTLGNIQDRTLAELFNDPANASLWRAHGGNQLPPICRHCTFHSPLADLHPDHLALKNITEFIGG